MAVHAADQNRISLQPQNREAQAGGGDYRILRFPTVATAERLCTGLAAARSNAKVWQSERAQECPNVGRAECAVLTMGGFRAAMIAWTRDHSAKVIRASFLFKSRRCAGLSDSRSEPTSSENCFACWDFLTPAAEVVNLLGTVALLFERVAVSVVAVLLPETRGVLRHKFQAAHPLDAFPSVEMRHYEADGVAMLGGERFAVVFQRE